MTKDEKVQFVLDLTRNMAGTIIKQIESGTIPEEWDGVELRLLISEHAQRNVYKQRIGRIRAFHNTVIVNNL